MSDSTVESYVSGTAEEVKAWVRDVCVIPAPSGKEDRRAEYVLNWWKQQGMQDAFIDGAKNVICPIGVNSTNDLVVLMAHTDVVFPDMETLPFREENGIYYAPGVGDDTANLAVLLHAVRYYLEQHAVPKTGILVVANSCEEGLGNLKGSREILRVYGDRVRELITVDGNLGKMITRAVGSHRYMVSAHTQGGHSFNAFGNPNAIEILAKLIEELYQIKVPAKEGSKTTFNVGTFSGGTSVNTIAEDAEMLCEYRSDDVDCLRWMEQTWKSVFERYQKEFPGIRVERIGERPCGIPPREPDFTLLKEQVKKAERDCFGTETEEKSGSTDANIPLSLGIPAVCIGGSIAFGAHTREEYLQADSLADGVRFVIGVLQRYFE